MAISVTTLHQQQLPNWWTMALAEITFDASYPTGGEPVAAADFKFTQLANVFPLGVTPTGRAPSWDRTNKKMKMFQTGAALSGVLSEVAAATDLSAEKVLVMALGRA